MSEVPNRFTPARNNYLSTSSADSATTYIDKIYDLGDDRGHEPKHLTNPFNRKSLLGNNSHSNNLNYERESVKNMDYDMGFLKYASLAYQDDKRAASINLDSYDGSYHNNYPAVPTPSTYENRYPVTASTYQDEPRTNTSNLQRGLTFGE